MPFVLFLAARSGAHPVDWIDVVVAECGVVELLPRVHLLVERTVSSAARRQTQTSLTLDLSVDFALNGWLRHEGVFVAENGDWLEQVRELLRDH